MHKAVEHDLVDARLDDYRRAMRATMKPARAASYGGDRVFDALVESFAAAPRLLAADREARAGAPLGSAAYLERLDRKIEKLIAARLARAVELLGALWLSAWDEAGRPLPPDLRVAHQRLQDPVFLRLHHVKGALDLAEVKTVRGHRRRVEAPRLDQSQQALHALASARKEGVRMVLFAIPYP